MSDQRGSRVTSNSFPRVTSSASLSPRFSSPVPDGLGTLRVKTGDHGSYGAVVTLRPSSPSSVDSREWKRFDESGGRMSRPLCPVVGMIGLDSPLRLRGRGRL